MKKYIILFVAIIFFEFGWSQNFFCFLDDTLYKQANIDIPQDSIENNSRSHDWLTVRLYFHVMSECNGTGGVSQNDLSAQFAILEADFNPHNICFSLYGVEYINATDDFTCGTGCNDQPVCVGNSNWDALFDLHAHENALDIWLLPAENTILQAGGISNSPVIDPGSFHKCAVIIGGKYLNQNEIPSHLLSHEIGHVLGLYHTYAGYAATAYYSNTNLLCKEYADGSNCTVCGDKVCDTPADPKTLDYVTVSNGICAYDEPNITDAHGDIYHPDMRNIMASLPLECPDHFTAGQGARMKFFLTYNFNLNKLLVNDVVLSSIQTIHNNPIATYYADHSIETDGQITVLPHYTNYGGTNPGHISLIAGEYVQLNPGLHVVKGSVFEVRIGQYCSELSSLNFAKTDETEKVGKKNTTLKNSENKSRVATIYPNPTNSILTLEYDLTETDNYQISFIDNIGNQIHIPITSSTNKTDFGHHLDKFDISNLSQGIYYLNLTINGKRNIQKFAVIK